LGWLDGVGVGGDALAELLVAALHLGVVAVDVLAANPNSSSSSAPSRWWPQGHSIALIEGSCAKPDAQPLE
jgi:hypothetical protein